MSLTRLTEKPLSKPEVEVRVEQAVQKILKICSPQKIILFGSSADGSAKPSSDLDIALIFSTLEECKAAKEVYKIPATLGFCIDFLIYDCEQYKKKVDRGGVCELIEREGRVVYQAFPPITTE